MAGARLEQEGRWRGMGKGQGFVSRELGGVWREKSGRRKRQEGEVAVASSPSYK